MNDKRKFARFACKIKCKFMYFEGDPETINIETDKKTKGKGLIIDISQGGAFLVSDERLTLGVPVFLEFRLPGKKEKTLGTVVRTGLMKNNPSEVAQKFASFSDKGETYIAVEFENPIDEFQSDRL